MKILLLLLLAVQIYESTQGRVCEAEVVDEKKDGKVFHIKRNAIRAELVDRYHRMAFLGKNSRMNVMQSIILQKDTLLPSSLSGEYADNSMPGDWRIGDKIIILDSFVCPDKLQPLTTTKSPTTTKNATTTKSSANTTIGRRAVRRYCEAEVFDDKKAPPTDFMFFRIKKNEFRAAAFGGYDHIEFFGMNSRTNVRRRIGINKGTSSYSGAYADNNAMPGDWLIGDKLIILNGFLCPDATRSTFKGCDYQGVRYAIGEKFNKGCHGKCECVINAFVELYVQCKPYCEEEYPTICAKGIPIDGEMGPPDENNCTCPTKKCSENPWSCEAEVVDNESDYARDGLFFLIMKNAMRDGAIPEGKGVDFIGKNSRTGVARRVWVHTGRIWGATKGEIYGKYVDHSFPEDWKIGDKLYFGDSSLCPDATKHITTKKPTITKDKMTPITKKTSPTTTKKATTKPATTKPATTKPETTTKKATTKPATTKPETTTKKPCLVDGKNIPVGTEFHKGCKEKCMCGMRECKPYCPVVKDIKCKYGKAFVEKGPADKNNCRCEVKKCPECTKTYGGNAKGACCQFPFKFNGKVYNECTFVGHGRSWCYTKGGKWGNCKAPTGCKSKVRTISGEGKGSCCVFPFKYKGKVYNECTLEGHDKSWCYTENNKWGNCPGDMKPIPKKGSPS